MLEGLKEKATQPIGPLPAFAWVVVAVGGYLGYKILKGRSSGTTAASTTATTVGASGETVAPSSSDMNALTSQISTLGNQINTLTGKVSAGGTTTGTGGGTTGGGTASNVGTAILKASHYAVDTATGKVNVKLPANVNFKVLGSYVDPSGVTRYLINYGGKTVGLQAGGDTVFTAASTAANTVASAATTTATVASTAVASTGVPAAAPTYSSNTAVTTPVGNPINGPKAATDVVQTASANPILQLGLPAFSQAAVNAAAIQIPSITSTPSNI